MKKPAMPSPGTTCDTLSQRGVQTCCSRALLTTCTSRSSGGSVRCVSSEWDAETHDRVADPQFRWGAAVVDRLDLEGDETVLDAGCGSGRVTAVLAERLPDGSVVALDGSTSMLETARRRLAPFGDRDHGTPPC